MTRYDSCQLANEQFLGCPHPGVREEGFSRLVEGRQKVPAAQLSGKDGDERIEMALGHERQQLVQALKMESAHPFRIGLEIRPDQKQPKVIGAERGDRIEIAADRIGVPVVPAEPPIVRGSVVHAEAMEPDVELAKARAVSRPSVLSPGSGG